MSYAGDVPPKQAWQILSEHNDAVLVDVRTRAEWSFVGVPDLRPLHKEAALISWQVYPDMARNPNFESEVAALSIAKDTPVLFLCRSGARSRAAAMAMTAQGFSRCYNVAEGFEGDPDGEHHRGRVNGWKAAGLPWVQS